MSTTEISLFWFRRDLRLQDNAGLYHALKENKQVLPVFIFDKDILKQLEERHDRRVDFIHQALHHMQEELMHQGSAIQVFHGTPEDAFKQLIKQYTIKNVYTNHDYEPYARERDEQIKQLLKKNDIEFKTYKDQCVFEKDEVIKDNGEPYTVFTPYSNKWKKTLTPFHYKAYPTKKYFSNLFKHTHTVIPSLKTLGFEKTKIVFSPPVLDELLIKDYKEQRDFPGIEGTTQLGIHLRFGTVSIRHLVTRARGLSETWLNELIWRDFFMMILWHFPKVEKHAFKKGYDAVKWRYNENDLNTWCKGQTGFPIVDAGMRELNATGFMHNRVRMIVASFLVKDLLIDWRLGEAYFARKLDDFDLSANNGNWQWAAGCGCDAAPYFRVFNPTEQQKKFDPDLAYIKKWVPEYDSMQYPAPMVDHAEARLRAIATYKKALAEAR